MSFARIKKEILQTQNISRKNIL